MCNKRQKILIWTLKNSGWTFENSDLIFQKGLRIFKIRQKVSRPASKMWTLSQMFYRSDFPKLPTSAIFVLIFFLVTKSWMQKKCMFLENTTGLSNHLSCIYTDSHMNSNLLTVAFSCFYDEIIYFKPHSFWLMHKFQWFCP